MFDVMAMMANMEIDRVTVRDLLRRHREVLALVAEGHQVEITNGGTVVAVMTAPSVDDLTLQDMADAGEVSRDWRERDERLRRRLARRLSNTDPAESTSTLSSAILDDREETDR
ncbi:MAG: hypothetical protein ACRD0P_02180 [Stackebrandtia sp.]